MSATSYEAGRASRTIVYGAASLGTDLRFPVSLAGRPTGLVPLVPQDVRVDLLELAAARLVVVAHPLHAAWSGTLRLLARMRVPYAVFLDKPLRLDSPSQGGARAALDVLAVCRDAVGLIAADEASAESAATIIGRPALVWPPVFDSRLATPQPDHREDPALRVAVLGGSTRAASFQRLVVPALEELRRDRPVEAYARFDLLRHAPAGMLKPVDVCWELDGWLRRWSAPRPHALVAPTGTGRLDLAEAVLLARYLGAVPVLSASDAGALGPAQGVLVAEDEPASWLEALRGVADPSQRERLLNARDAWSCDALGSLGAWERLEQVGRWAAIPGQAEVKRRIESAQSLDFGKMVEMLPGFCDDPAPAQSLPLRVTLGLKRRAESLFSGRR